MVFGATGALRDWGGLTAAPAGHEEHRLETCFHITLSLKCLGVNATVLPGEVADASQESVDN